MVMQLMVIAGPDKGLAIPLNEEGTVRVGRSQSILTRLTDPHVSRVHCQVLAENGKYVLIAFGADWTISACGRRARQRC